MAKIILLTLLLLFSLTVGDNDMLQDVCVADLTSSIKVNGYPCKAGEEISAEDFTFRGIAKDGGLENNASVSAIFVSVKKFAGLNTLGMSLIHTDLAPGGAVPLHSHPRATELVFVLRGQVDVGFITTSNKHISEVLSEKEVLVIPKGLIHYMINKGDAPATVLTAFNSQLPGSAVLGPSLFAAHPPLPDDVLTANFHLSTDEVQKIKHSFAPNQH